jgi:hypothetical protein
LILPLGREEVGWRAVMSGERSGVAAGSLWGRDANGAFVFGDVAIRADGALWARIGAFAE